MSYEPKVTEVLKKIPNRFLLSLSIAKRARQIKDGAVPLVEVEEAMKNNQIAIAIEEIRQGKIDISTEEVQSDQDLLLEEVNQYLDPSAPSDEESDEPKPDKDKPKPKSRSLAA